MRLQPTVVLAALAVTSAAYADLVRFDVFAEVSRTSAELQGSAFAIGELATWSLVIDTDAIGVLHNGILESPNAILSSTLVIGEPSLTLVTLGGTVRVRDNQKNPIGPTITADQLAFDVPASGSDLVFGDTAGFAFEQLDLLAEQLSPTGEPLSAPDIGEALTDFDRFSTITMVLRLSENQFVRFTVLDSSISVIPAPASAMGLGLALAPRRRRTKNPAAS